MNVETVSTACGQVHDRFGWCNCCQTPGTYYFGDRSSERRALTLERVLEAIERDHADGSTFTTWGLAAGLWGGRVYAPLRWLEHLGLIARVPRPRNQLNIWHVTHCKGGSSNP